MVSISCPFRQPLETGDDDVAVCDFVRRLTGAADDRCRVHQSACEVCVQQPPLASPETNPVISSLVFHATENADGDSDSAQFLLRNWAQSAILLESAIHFAPATYCCDVLLDCRAGGRELAQIADRVLDQKNVFVVLHLIVDGGTDMAIQQYKQLPNVRLHHVAKSPLPGPATWQVLHTLVPRLETPFVAVQTADTLSRPDRLFRALFALDRDGGEFYAAAIDRNDSLLVSSSPDGNHNEITLQLPTLVMRRATVADMGGICRTRLDAATEFLTRATKQQRRFIIDEHAVADSLPAFGQQPDALIPLMEPIAGSGDGFPQRRAACDVVLPFRDQLDFVRQSLESLLAQREVDVVIHLVDDDSREPTDDFFNSFQSHPNIRFYRNRRNLGPFSSFNNVSHFAETSMVAVQDADDISLPERLSRCCHLLEVSGADLMGSATELFGDPQIIPHVAHIPSEEAHSHQNRAPSQARKFFRRSKYPRRRSAGYYLENPTLVMKVDWFRQLGGYADFGEAKRNRTGVDTELQARAYYSRSNIAVTRDVLLRYRCHSSSATQHCSSGLGSQANQESHQELNRRLIRYGGGSFDPRPFGSLHRHVGLTRPIRP